MLLSTTWLEFNAAVFEHQGASPSHPGRKGKNIIIFHDDKLGSALALHTVPSKRAGSQPALGTRPGPQQQTEAACARGTGGGGWGTGQGGEGSREANTFYTLPVPGCPPSRETMVGKLPALLTPHFLPTLPVGPRKGHLLIKTQILHMHNSSESTRTQKGGFWGTRLQLA